MWENHGFLDNPNVLKEVVKYQVELYCLLLMANKIADFKSATH